MLLNSADPKIFNFVEQEKKRQLFNLELIASENFVSPAVLEAAGSILTNKYAEGYPGKRYYGGCGYCDEVEKLAQSRAKELFCAEHVNVQPHSGSNANLAVYLASLNPGDRILSMKLDHGGHLTHGSSFNISGKLYDIMSYGVDPSSGLIDYDEVESIAKKIKPKLIVAGASAYPREIDFKKFHEIALKVNAKLFVDMAHIAGLVASSLHQSPFPYADYVSTTTHKTLRGPRGGIILCKEKFAKKINSAVFPGLQGGPLMHIIAAKAVAFKEALQPQFKKYQQRLVKNAKVLALSLQNEGLNLFSNGTDNHLILIDLRKTGVSGKAAEESLEKANITVNKNQIPADPTSSSICSGIRIGTPAVSTRGMGDGEMKQIAKFIALIIKNHNNQKIIAKVKNDVKDLCSAFPLFYNEQ